MTVPAPSEKDECVLFLGFSKNCPWFVTFAWDYARSKTPQYFTRDAARIVWEGLDALFPKEAKKTRVLYIAHNVRKEN